jgi:hypothetical protein
MSKNGNSNGSSKVIRRQADKDAQHHLDYKCEKAQTPKTQDVLLHVGAEGHRHHTSVTRGHVMAPLAEALSHYLRLDVSIPQQG